MLLNQPLQAAPLGKLNQMSKFTTKSILQIVAVIAIFIGAVNASKVVVSIIVYKTTSPELQDSLDLYYMT